jgi:hypothetical protein
VGGDGENDQFPGYVFFSQEVGYVRKLRGGQEKVDRSFVLLLVIESLHVVIKD